MLHPLPPAEEPPAEESPAEEPPAEEPPAEESLDGAPDEVPSDVSQASMMLIKKTI